MNDNRLFCRIVTLMACCLLPGAIYSPSYAEDHTLGREIIAQGSYNYLPYSFQNEKGEIDGFDNALFREVAKAAGLNLRLELDDWWKVRENLASGTIDVITGMYYSKERDNEVDFSIPFITVKYSIFVRKNSSIKTLADLRNKEIVVMRGSIAHDFLTEQGVTEHIVLTDDTPSALRLLSSGRHDCALIVRLQGLHFLKELNINTLKVVGEPFLPRKFCFAVRNGDEALLFRINEALSVIKQSGKYDELYDKWFGILERDAVSLRKVLRYALFILLPLLGVIFVIAFWSWALKRQVRLTTRELEGELFERKQAEKALQESEKKLRMIVDQSPVPMVVLDEVGDVLSLNNKFTRSFGYTIDDVSTTEDWWVAAYPDKRYREIVRKSWEAAVAESLISGKEIETQTWEVTCKGGSKRTCEFTMMPLGSISVTTINDITERKRAEDSVRESHERLLTVLNSLDAIVYVADMETYEILFVNKYLQDIFGDVTGKVCWQTLQRDQAGPCDFCTNKYLLDKDGHSMGVYLWEFQNTVTGRWFNILDRAIKWVNGRTVRLEIATDITSRKQMENALKNAKEGLEQRVEERTFELKKAHEQLLHSEKLSAIGGLSASIAHEFNNPLQGIMTVIQGVKRRATLNEEDAKLVDMAITECDRMKDLIKSLQDFNRPSSGRMAPMNIHAAIDSLLLLSKKEHKTKGITIETNYAKDMPQIKAVADQIKQVLLNLLSNAAYACEGGGTITINTEVSKENITIRIQDTGKGINPEHMGQIFDPFFTTKPEIKGTGLGLSVSYGIIKKHGGRIEVESEVDKGTTFTITLPIEGVKNAE